jgi:hypothetical protein
MPTRSTTARWLGSAFAAAATLAAVTLAAFGTAEHGTVTALRVTARFSFLLFFLAYAGGGLAALVGPALRPLRQHGREFGLAFAAAHLVHVLLIIWLCWIGAAPVAGVFRFFAPPLVCIYVLALFSVGRLQQVLGRTVWRLLRTVAMTYIAYAFATDFLRDPLGHGVSHMIQYIPFAALSLAGPVLHFFALLPLASRLRASA